MNLFPKLLPQRDQDPTANWSEAPLQVPDVCLETAAVGQLKFGDALAAARYLGKPDEWRRSEPDYLELVYARAGFQLDFEHERLAYVAFLIGPDAGPPVTAHRAVCTPQLRGGRRFSAQTSREDLIATLGDPESIDAEDKDEVVLSFFAQGLVLEFELNSAGRVQRWNVYPEEGISG